MTIDGKARSILVRPSTEADVPAMLEIYMHHIQRGLDETELEPLHLDDLKRRRKNMKNGKLPHLVAELNGRVAGYCYAVPFRKRPAYRYTLKHSIYVDKDCLHAGVGRALMPALIQACEALGYRQLIAYIDASNQPSMQLHLAFGFQQAGYLHAVGFKFGRWIDSVVMQRGLGQGDALPPDAPMSRERAKLS